MALTATATPDMVTEIQDHLRLSQDTAVFMANIDRKNLKYSVKLRHSFRDGVQQLTEDIKPYYHKSGIVYVKSKSHCARIAKALVGSGICAEQYHADLPDSAKESILSKWMAGEIDVLVGTVGSSLVTNNVISDYLFPDSSWIRDQQNRRQIRDAFQCTKGPHKVTNIRAHRKLLTCHLQLCSRNRKGRTGRTARGLHYM